jgi:N-acetylglucosaminyldiphosphoundecaprenol N-acetyl-beta-D-mannosaminyltransferase
MPDTPATALLTPPPTVDVAGCPVGALDRAGWLAHLIRCVDHGPGHHHVSLNAAKWVAMRHDASLRRAVLGATSVGADGAGIVAAARWLGRPLPGRATGCDLAHDLLEHAAGAGWRVALVGAAAPVVGAVAARWRATGVEVVAARSGYFAPDEERDVAEAIAAARPDLLLVAMGTPRAELFVARWRPVLGVPLAMGVGGAFDVMAGAATRAPAAVGEVGLEWAWRWAYAPRARFRRAIVDSARFAVAVAAGRRHD